MASRLDKDGGDSRKRKASVQHRSSKFLKEDDDVIDLTESPIKSDDDRKYGDISSTSSSELESQLDDARDQLLYFNDDKDVPIFRSGKCTYTTEEIVKILWSTTADLIKCKKGVRKCQRNAVFLIDLRYTPLEDLRADGLPQYDIYGGKRTLTVKVERPEDGDDAEVIITSRSKAKLKGNMYHFERLYHSWTLESGNKFHRRIMHMRDSRNDIVNNVAFVQYAFDGKEENVCEKPHQNTKKGKAPSYTRTKASVVRNIDTNLTLMGPKEAVFQATREAGGVMKAESMSDLPRGARQGYYRNSVIKAPLPAYLQGKEKDDELLDVILKMKTEEEPFVRKVTLEKENLTIVLATEPQLGDLARYSTSELDFSIVQLDPTFNLGSYECTPISYRNVMLRSKRSGASPVRLGPVLIHYRKDEKTFRHFLQTVVDEKPKLKEILSCGTDGETALINAIQSVLPKAEERSVRCFRHLQNNMQSALSSFGVPGRQRDYIDDVFGSIDKDGIYQAGLLDAESPEEFDATLQSLKQKWEERGDTSHKVYSWVLERGEMLKKRAIASVRRAARLPSMSSAVNIPAHFFTNDAESNNNRLKAKKGRKPSGFIGTIEAVKSIAEEEEEEFAQAIGGVSQKYELRPEFVNFAVANFMEWKSDERAHYLQKLQKASMEELYAAESPESLGLVPESVARRQEVRLVDMVEDESDMAPFHFDDSDFEEEEEEVEEEVPNELIIGGLSSLEKDDRLQHLSSRTRAGLIEKAKLLLSSNSVWRGPVTRNGSPSFSVTSQSGKRPNYVVLENAGKVECECPHWRATRICSHALAVAAKEDEIPSYLSWYGKRKMAKKRNLTDAANIHVKTSTLGNKGRRPKRQRSRTAPSAAIVENSGDRSKSRQYKLKWLKDTKAFKCFGCESAIRIPGEIPEPPNDVIASTNEYRSFMKDGKLQVHFGPTHYHLRSRCIVAKNADFNPQTHLTITDSDRRSFQEAHKHHLQNEFKI